MPAVRLARSAIPRLVLTALGALAALAVTAGMIACSPARPADAALAAEHQLEERLLAPCCWRQPLRDHESELASQLRQELRERLAAGEAAAAIESDMVQRYGERIRALPGGGRDPRWMIIAACAALAGAGLFALSRLVKGKQAALSATLATTSTAAAAAVDPRYQDRLDDELAAVD